MNQSTATAMSAGAIAGMVIGIILSLIFTITLLVFIYNISNELRIANMLKIKHGEKIVTYDDEEYLECICGRNKDSSDVKEHIELWNSRKDK